ncbi:MFS transporter [bacterium]|nr:MFS transporter [bacterium]
MSRSPLFIIFLVVFIDLLGFGIVLPLLPRYGKHFDAAGWQLGVLMASFSAMQFLFAPVWGRLSDHFGRRPILLIGLLGSTLSYAAFGGITQLGNQGLILGLSPLLWLFISRVAAGIAGATIPTAQAYIADVTDAKGRGKGMALIGAAFGVGFTFGPILGAQFVAEADVAPSPAPGYVAAVLSGMAFLAAIVMLPESLKPGSDPARKRHWFDMASFRVAMTRPYMGWLYSTIFLSTFAFSQFESTLSLLTDHLSLNAKYNFYVFAYIGFILTIAQGFLIRRFLPKVGEFRMGIVGVIMMTIGLLLIGVSSLQSSLAVLYVVLPITVVGFSATTPSINSLLSLNAGDDEQGGILGVGQSMSSLARILGPMLGLSLLGLDGASQALPYWVAAGVMSVCVLMVLGLRNCTTSLTKTEAQG